MKKFLSFLLILVMILSSMPMVFADEQVCIDSDIWAEYFLYNSERAEAELDQRCELATEIYFGKKSDYLTQITDIDGVDISSDGSQSIKVYEVDTVYYILAEDDGAIIFPEYSYDMFCGFEALTNISFGDNIDTSNVLSMSYLFFGCTSLTNLDLSNFVFNENVGIYYIFGECISLKSVTFPAGLDMSLFTDEDPFSISGKKFAGWYLESTFANIYTEQETESDITLYPLFIDKANIELDLSSQNYVLQSSDDIAVFEIDEQYAMLDGFEITYYFDWGGSEAESTDGVDFSGDFAIEIYRPEDDDFAEYHSGRVENALHVSGVLVYDGKGATSGEVPTDTNIYENGDEIVIQEPGTLEKKGYTFLGWIYGSNLFSMDSAIYQGGETTTYSGTTATAYWSLDYSAPTKENDYTLDVDTDAVESIQWYRQNKGEFTLTGSDFENNDNLSVSFGEIDGDIIKSHEIWNEISLSIDSDVLDIDDTATIYFNNLPENYSCSVNWDEQEIVDNKLTVTAGWGGVYIEVCALDEIETPFEITKIECNGTITEELKGETNRRIADASKAGQYSVKTCYIDPLYGMDASITLGFVDAVKLSFDNNNAYGETDPLYNLPGRTITLPGEDVFSIEGYKMFGWSTDPDGNGTFYPLNSEYVVGDEDVTLYAMWDIVYGEATYNWSDDHSSCTATCTQTANGNSTLTETAAATVSTKDGYTVYEVNFSNDNFAKQEYKVKLEEKQEDKDSGNVDDKKVVDSGNTEDTVPETKSNGVIIVIAAVVVVAAVCLLIFRKKKA